MIHSPIEQEPRRVHREFSRVRGVVVTVSSMGVDDLLPGMLVEFGRVQTEF